MSSPPRTRDIYAETLGVFDQSSSPYEPLTTVEVADALGCSRRTTYKRLVNLVNRGDLQTKKVGSSGRVWWLPATDLSDDASANRNVGTDGIDTVLSSDQITNIFNRLSHFIWLIRSDGILVDVNDTALSFGGLVREDVIDTYLLDTGWWQSSEYVQTQLKDVIDQSIGGMSVRRELEVEGNDRVAKIDASITPTTDEQGEVEFLILEGREIIDQTDHERSQEFQILVENLTDIVWITTADPEEFIYVNPAYERIWGRERKRVYENGLGFIDAVHPADRERVKAAYTSLPTDEYDEKFRINRPDGSIRWIHAQAVPIRDEIGEIHRIVGLSEDITEHVEREQTLRDLKDEYETIFANAQDAIFLVDVEQTGSDVTFYYNRFNPTEESITGLTTSDVQGKTPQEVFGEQVGVVIAEHYQRCVEEGKSISYEVRLVMPSGTIDFQTNLAPVIVDGNVSQIVGIARNITDQKVREQRLEHQQERLSALNSLYSVVHDITDIVIEQSTREEIERSACERLVASDSYKFAWIAEADSNTEGITSRVEVGVENFLESIEFTEELNETIGRGPVGRVFRSGEMNVSMDVFEDPEFEGWRHLAEKHGFCSVAMIPIVHEGSQYGVLGVYSERTSAFAEEEQEVIGKLGEIIGHAIASVERKRALMSNEIIEIAFQLPNFYGTRDLNVSVNGTIMVDRLVPVDDRTVLLYGSATKNSMNAVYALIEAETSSHWESVVIIETDDDTTRFEVKIVEPRLLPTVIANGGYIHKLIIEEGDAYLQIHFPPSSDIQDTIETVTTVYPGAELITRRQMARPDRTLQQITPILADRLTERQQLALETGYFAGFFEWPRHNSGEDVAASLGIGASTFHQHIRKAEKKILDVLFNEL